jgi:AcrR family transcriptional regulator
VNAREANKAKRRDAILDAAIDLLNARDAAEVTTGEIANRAGVAPATVYNLIGTRDEMMLALVHRVLERLSVSLAALDPDDPIAAARVIVDETVRGFTANSAAFRQIVQYAQRRSDPNHELRDPSDLQVAAMERAQQLGILRRDVDAEALGRQIYVSYMGALTLWANGRLDDDGFGVVARHGLLVALTAGASERHRDRFAADLGVVAVTLVATSWRT